MFLIRNTNFAVSLPLTALRCAGFWAPELVNKRLYNLYATISFMYLLGIYLTIQVIDLYMIWGDIPMMTGVAFLLFTNLAQALKILNLLVRRRRIQAIIEDNDRVFREVETVEGREIIRSCDRETSFLLLLYVILTLVTTTGWASSAEKGKLPFQAWYPYDTSRTPAFQLTYIHQVSALVTTALLNVCKDTLVTTLIAQGRCRLRLLAARLRGLTEDLSQDRPISKRRTSCLLTPSEESVVKERLRSCVVEHQSVLDTVQRLQAAFSEPTFLQLMVSLIIICVTAFQLISQTGNLVRFLSMGTYLLNMMFQVFLYCYQGNHLTEESAGVAGAAYLCRWYVCGAGVRRALALLMVRCRRVAKITAGGFTTLSLATFMAVIKTSYSLYTLLQQVDGKRLYVIIQTGELYRVWGNVVEMTAVLFLLSTNVSQSIKLFNVTSKKNVVKEMVEEFEEAMDDETTRNKNAEQVAKSLDYEGKIQLLAYLFMSITCILGWFFSTDEGELLFKAWYPYDVTKSPAYELSYAHQCIALPVTAMLNISSDTLVTSLIAQCRCRLRLLGRALTSLCDGLDLTKDILSDADQDIVERRLKRCAVQHEACLRSARRIEDYFSFAILVQFCVSMLIICVSAYQLAFATTNASEKIGMAFYLIVMAYQVFVYCYQGNELLLESENLLGAAYECPWYKLGVRSRRSLLIIMTRTRRVATLTAGGFTVISLSCFTSIIKASYSFYTVLQQMEA
ncbi:odorant receptor Or1-like [Aricia agestis]|uniref:odorant receptor Or1-like n=1 Tax=Aricia agestis TaxID=91739 RepID=UPI001C201754|nr:odorant receptor Or1-like [Aricia agestis]